MEDLRRDVSLLYQGGEATFIKRMGQMNFAPVPMVKAAPGDGSAAASATANDASVERSCVARGEGNPLSFSAVWPATLDEATAGAALISLAKAWDLDGGPPRRMELCITKLAFESGIGVISEGPLVQSGLRFSSGSVNPARMPDELNYDALKEKVKTIYLAIEASN